MYQRDNATGDPSCAAEQFSSGLVGGCEAGHVMDTATFASTVVSEWDLVCGGAGNNQVEIFRLQNIIYICICGQGQLLVDLGYTAYSAGVLLGVLVPGLLADRFGRKRLMFAAQLTAAVATLASAFAPSYTVFLITRRGPAAARGLKRLKLELQMKVPEDCMKFYFLNLREGSFEALVKTAILLPIAIYSSIHD